MLLSVAVCSVNRRIGYSCLPHDNLLHRQQQILKGSKRNIFNNFKLQCNKLLLWVSFWNKCAKNKTYVQKLTKCLLCVENKRTN